MSVTRLLLLGLCLAALPCLAQTSSPEFAAGRLWGYFMGVGVVQEACTARFPERKAEIDAIADGWLARNRPPMEKALKESVDRLMRIPTTPAERDEALQLWEQAKLELRDHARAEVSRRIGEQPRQFCDAMLGLLGSGSGELSVRFPEEFRTLGISAP